jgi:hypothetical protein
LQSLHGMRPRVVLLAKPYPLAGYLERRLATTGCLVGVVHEQPPSGWTGLKRETRRLVKRVGLARTMNVLAYHVYQRLVRAGELRRRMATLDAGTASPPPVDVPRRAFASLNSAEARDAIAALAPDVLLVHGTGILKSETFGLAPLAVNVHCGILPDYRGHDSTFWALATGDYDNVGVSLHVIDAGVDTGRLVAEARVKCGPGDSDIDVWITAFARGVDLAVDLVETLRRGDALPLQPPPARPGKHFHRKGLSDYLAFARRRRRLASTRPLAKAG